MIRRRQLLRRVSAVFDLTDAYLADRGTAGEHPRPVGRVRFFLTARWDGDVCTPLRRPIELLTTRNPSGFHLFYGRIVVDGSVRLGPEDGTYTVAVRSDDGSYQEALAKLALPAPAAVSLAPYPFALLPAYGYPFPLGSTAPGKLGPTLLRGEVLHPDGRGATWVEVSSEPAALFSCTTGADGQWVLVYADDLPRQPVTVAMKWPGRGFCASCELEPRGRTRTVKAEIVPGRTTSVRQTALDGRVFAVNGVPTAGAAIRVVSEVRRPGVPYRGEGLSGTDGLWSFYFDLKQRRDLVTVDAILPDQSRASQSNVPVVPKETRTVELRATSNR